MEKNLVENSPSVVILTGSELRHDFFRVAVAADSSIAVLESICEMKPALNQSLPDSTPDVQLAREHLGERSRSELDFFQGFVKLMSDNSKPHYVDRGAINTNPQIRERLRELNPDIVICYGTSIIREPILSDFASRFLNIHLGLSPYYRGGGTNFWPLVNGEPEFVGVTFMQIDRGVDTGPVVHQIRATIYPEDSIHTIGNRLLRDTALITPRIVNSFPHLPGIDQSEMNPHGLPERVYRKRDFTGSSVMTARRNLASGMLIEYLENKGIRDKRAPLVDAFEGVK